MSWCGLHKSMAYNSCPAKHEAPCCHLSSPGAQQHCCCCSTCRAGAGWFRPNFLSSSWLTGHPITFWSRPNDHESSALPPARNHVGSGRVLLACRHYKWPADITKSPWCSQPEEERAEGPRVLCTQYNGVRLELKVGLLCRAGHGRQGKV